MLLGVNMNFLFAVPVPNGTTTLVNLILLIVAAIETVVGLSLIVNLHKLSGTIDIPVTGLKG